MHVVLTKEAEKQYSRIPYLAQKKVKKKLLALENYPYSGKKLTGKFSGLYSLKAWPYRIIYKINKKEEDVWVVAILHRQGAYKA